MSALHLRWFTAFAMACSVEFISSGSGVVPCQATEIASPREPATPAGEFGLTIRSTPHRTPAEEQKSFHLPEGFEIDLVASEPQIAKPLNLAFDASGKLWVTQTTHYPFPAKEGEIATDSIVVLEDKDRDGTYESQKVFASGLNIPIGLLPVPGGAICFSIPNILFLKDTDGDGVCDSREVLYGPFDTTRDTHGMVNSIRDGGDGWIYACHGFNNQSEVAGKDGHRVSMQSGNVFRFRLDGSRIELYSQGQVNPFGLTQDRWGGWFSADCHSKPITQLIRGGCYPSFGRPDDGLGFAPSMMDHLHGSTAIAGLAHTKNSAFPESMRDQFLSGNVMTCRINRNQLNYRGATVTATELPDLLTSEDSWFRPVDLVFGPDGALYIADFYNKVIGHYEVPLDHPDRDRKSGRIWRIRWKGAADTTLNPANFSRDFTQPLPDWQSLAALDLQRTSDALRWIASAQNICEQKQSSDGIQALLAQAKPVYDAKDPVLLQAYWIALRKSLLSLRQSDPSALATAISRSIEGATSIHQPATGALLKVLPACKESQCTELAIRLVKHLRDVAGANESQKGELQFAVDWISDAVEDDNMEAFIELLAGWQKPNDWKSYSDKLIAIGVRQQKARGSVSPKLRDAAYRTMEQLASNYLKNENANSGNVAPLEWVASSSNADDRRPWAKEARTIRLSADPRNNSTQATELVSSFPLGETYVGKWSTPPFSASTSTGTKNSKVGSLAKESIFAFSLAGHNGQPPAPDHHKNFARLLVWDERAGTTTEVYRSYPPRNDVAARIEWDLAPWPNGKFLFEVIDGDSGGSYAWIAVGAFNTPGLQSGADQSDLQSIRTLSKLFGIPSTSTEVKKLVSSNTISSSMRYAMLRPMLVSAAPIEVELSDAAIEAQHWDLFESSQIPSESAEASIAKWKSNWEKQTPTLFKRLSANQQSQFVKRIAKYREAAGLLASWTQKGSLPVDVLSTLPQSWWGGLSEEEQESLATARQSLASRVDRSQLIAEKLAQIRDLAPDAEVGRRMFVEKCSQCHKLGDVGKVVGPQLEGIGNRGVERLLEDILWPDRNVDEAFRVTLIRLEDGVTLSGLVTNRTKDSLTLVDQTGKSQTIAIDDIETEKHSALSLMPSDMEKAMTAQEIASLLDFLRLSAKK